MTREEALWVGLEGDPADTGRYGLLGDCILEQEDGRDALGEGLATMATLRVAVDHRNYKVAGVNSYEDNGLTKTVRALGSLSFVTNKWFRAAVRRLRGTYPAPSPLGRKQPLFRYYVAAVALAWGDLSAAEKEEAVALLGGP